MPRTRPLSEDKMSTGIIDVELPTTGWHLKDLPPNRLMILGYRNGKELACLLDADNPGSWRSVIERLISCFDSFPEKTTKRSKKVAHSPTQRTDK